MAQYYKTITAFLIASLAILFVVFSFLQMPSSDFWGHALHGKILWEQGHFATFSEYSCVPNQTVIQYDYGFALIAHFTFKFFGFFGLSLLKIILLALIVIVIHLWIKELGGNLAVTSIAMFFILCLCYSRFTPRGSAFSLLFLATVFLLLTRYLKTKTKTIYYLLPIQILWVNIHGLWILAIMIVLTFAADLLMVGCYRKFHTKSLQDELQKALELFLLAFLLTIVSFCNFGGYQKLLVPFTVLLNVLPLGINIGNLPNNQQVYKHILEYLPLYINSLNFTTAILGTLVLITIVVAVAHCKELFFAPLVLLVGFLFSGIRIARLITCYVIMAAPLVLSYFWKSFGQKTQQKSYVFWGLGAIALNIFLLFFLVTNNFSKYADNYHTLWSTSLPNRVKPVAAVNFLKKNDFSGNIYTTYEDGAYMAFFTFPKLRIFQSSLVNFSSSHFLLVRKTKTNILQFFRALKKYKIDIVLLPHYKRLYHKYHLSAMYHFDEWYPVYMDEAQIIFVRKRSRIGVEKKHLALTLEKPVLLQKTLVKNSTLYLNPLADLFVIFGKAKIAQAYLQRSLKLKPDAKIFHKMAKVKITQKQFNQALPYAISAIKLNPQVNFFSTLEKIMINIPVAKKNIDYQEALKLLNARKD